MSQYDKMVKMACKPKNAPPKPKYVDPLVSATFSDDGSLQDITRSLSLRLREPNAVVAFKALLVLHMMIRTGNTENLLQTLSSGSGDPLRLRNVADSFAGQNQGQPFEGYAPPTNMGMYAMYLDIRIKCFKDLGHDYVRTQTESNRRSDGLGANSRRLRHLAVEKGLLREVKTIQRMLDALVVCRFYEDNLQDENTIIAFRMLIKDLLVLFQAGNEGVSNILEHYFEMSKSDATEAFSIYKSFIKQTDRVVDYLGMARKLHNVINIPVPNLKHAPTGLVKALEEYLNDPDFENNRVEYRKSLGVVEGRPGRESSPNNTSTTPSKPTPAPAASSSTTSAPPVSTQSSAPAPAAPPGANQKIQDFFDSIQADHQPTMFGGSANNAPYMQQQQQPQFPFMQQSPQQQPFNPFRQSVMMPQQTGFMAPQMTGFQMPNQTGMGMGMGMMQPQMTGQMAFGQQQSQQPFAPQQQQQQQQPQAFIQPQPTMATQQTGFLQPQQTGTSNPFRQSMMMPNPTGAPFTQPSSPSGNTNPNMGGNIQRPGSTPASFPPNQNQNQNQQQLKPLTAQPTGSKNPFAPAGGVSPVMAGQGKERGMSMNELAMNRFNQFQTQSQTQAMGQGQGQTQTGGMNGTPGGGGGGGSGMADIASAFTFDQKATSPSTNDGNDFLSQFGSLSVNTNSTGNSNAFGSNTFSGFGSNTNTSSSSNPTSPTAGTISSSSGGFLHPQKTGYGGSSIKPFKPSSSFGSQLMADLGSVPEDTMGNPGGGGGGGGLSPGITGGNNGGLFGNNQNSSFTNNNTTGSAQNQNQNQHQNQFGQLSPQMTGSNPFRQSMFGSLGAQPTGMGMGGMGGALGAGSPFAGQNQSMNQRGGGAFGQGQGQGQGQGMGMGMGMGQGQQQGGSLI